MKQLSFMILLLSSSILFSMTDEEWARRVDPRNPEREKVDQKLTELYQTLQGNVKKHFLQHYIYAGTYKHAVTTEPFLSIFKEADLLDSNNFPKIVFDSRIKR